ncbi:DNA alkylation repair protein [miscellaneous Crenarchaeota group-1 archaeon SG8-32-1]|uniref:DNA alkylation repair protein n=1 Tax=miscellaneous Crenarchaeota group-1 archaeon SG8-32-1 TaxID=1685124 RepID=A0A0M0C042_9ARCH|nr:MAG: DNA alkylation repair protein [miscellaneous Crenarchaeota group-1 archaeon SG8-32-1]
MLDKIRNELLVLGDQERAKKLAGFFKTGKGQYGEGDVFLGIPVPEQRKVAKKYIGLSFDELLELLRSKFHELRLTALLILVIKYSKADDSEKEIIYNFYLKNTQFVNNWDLVDLTAPKIVGDYLLYRDRSILFELVKSSSLWERRIAVLATFCFIKNNDFNDTFSISKLLIKDKHDLIHKAVGWMLREIGKRDQKALEEHLMKYYKQMPRTMLRYAMEKFEEEKRKYFLSKQ